MKRMNKQVNQDLKNLTNWPNANKICLNVSKTEVVIQIVRKLTDVSLKLKLNGKRLYLTNLLKYLGTSIDENLNWKYQICDIAINVNKVNCILSKLRHFIDRKLWSQYMQYLNPIYITRHLFWHKIQIQLKDYLFCKRNPYELYIPKS